MNRPSLVDREVATESPAPSGGYSTRDVAALLGVSESRVRSYVRAGLLSPAQGSRGEHLFSFQDLILLRTAKSLLEARIPRRRVHLALEKLRGQIPDGRALSGIRISAQGHQVVARDGGEAWNPESGQVLFDFAVSELEQKAATLMRHDGGKRRRAAAEPEPETAEDWFDRGFRLEEEGDAPGAEAAYGKAAEIDPGDADAHLNLGRLLHERGDFGGAEERYRRALEARPDDPTAAFNLGVALQDLGRLKQAAEAYEQAIDLDSQGDHPDAHYNLSGVYESLGEREAAFRHLRTYRRLLRESP